MGVSEEELAQYRHRLWGLIPPERIVTFRIPRPSKELVEAYQELEDPTPAIADILDEMGINGIIPACQLSPVIPGCKVVGPAVTLRYLPERHTPTQSFLEKATAKLADRDALEEEKKSLEAKGQIDDKVSGAMDFMNLPSKNDVAKLLEEIERVRSRVVKQQRMLKKVEAEMEEMKKLLGKEAPE